MTADRTAGKTAPLSSLGEFITQRMNTLGLSFRQVAEASGGLVSHSQAHYLASGRGRSQAITEDVLNGLVQALRCRPSDILDRLDLADGGVEYIPPPESALMDATDRAIVDSVIRQLVAKRLERE